MTGRSMQQGMQHQRMLSVLQEVWGYTAFREPQESVILNALACNDGLVVMATGGGKSLCYQVPAIVSGQPCIVISPLIALMEDQVAALNARGVKAAYLGSAQTSSEVKRRAWQGDYQLLYITPELACNQTSQLQHLHATKRIGLIAVDEAHCVSEWGHDFRPDYRQLGCLRQALPGVPILAVTATATQRVRQDILNNLGMGKPGGPQLQQWVMTFQRTNIHLAVQLKAGSTAANNLSALVAEAREAQTKGRRMEPTLIYAQTVREVDDIAAHLQAKDVSAVKYHAKMSVNERMSAHRAFQRDDAAVMVATVAFGMGIDKPNIRRIIHFGIPSSLESYYQQVGRAGRDGLPSQCCLMWCPQDFNTMDLIKGSQGLSGWNLESHSRGMAALRSYTNSGDCRHALLVNFFQPGTLQSEGPCAGGCDNCKRRAEAAATAAASGGGASAGGVPLGQTDVTEPARLLIATVKGLRNCFGTARAVSVLRGSKAKSIEPWMQDIKDQHGNPLHGAGSSRSDDWWKGLAGVLMGQGYLQSQHKSNAQGSAWSVLQVTQKGHQFLSHPSAHLHVMLPVHMEAEESKKQQKEAAERQRAAAREAAQQQWDEVEVEKEQLMAALKQTRKQIADSLNQAPDTLVNDATLNQMKELRPTTDDELMLMGGFGAKALMHFAVPLLQVVKDFCNSSKHLKSTTDWHFIRRSKDAAQQRGLQQANGQFAQWNQQQQAQAQGSAAAAGGNPFSQFGLAGVTQHGADRLGSGRLSGAASQQLGGSGIGFAAVHGGPKLFTDPQVYQSFLDSKVLSEPKGAATAAWERFEAGDTADKVANQRDKPIQVSTAIGYLAEAAAAAGAAGGCSLELLQRLQHEAGLTGSAAAEALLWKIVAVVSGEAQGFSTLKKALPDDVSYGQIKLVAALLSLQALPQLNTDDCQLELPTVQVDRSPAVDKLLSQPGNAAQQLYKRWRAGVPLSVVGTLDGLNLQLQAVLSALAEMAAAGYPADMQQLADAAQLQEVAALQICAAVRAAGQSGIHAVKQQLDPHVGYGQIKVVAALMAVKGLWFSPDAVALRELEGLADMDTQVDAADCRGSAGSILQQGVQQALGHQGLHSAGLQGHRQPGGTTGSSGQCQPDGPGDGTTAGPHDAAAGTPAVLESVLVGSRNQQVLPPTAVAAASQTAEGDAEDLPVADSSETADSGDLTAAVGKRRAGFLLGNKSGKRRRPTAIAPPPAKAAAPSTAGTATASTAVVAHAPIAATASVVTGVAMAPTAAPTVRQQQRQGVVGCRGMGAPAAPAAVSSEAAFTPAPAPRQQLQQGHADPAAAANTPAPATAGRMAPLFTPSSAARPQHAACALVATPATASGAVALAAKAVAFTPASNALRVQQQQQQHTPSSSLMSPATGSAANVSQQQVTVTPANATVISQDTVLNLLWSGGCTAAQIRAKLGVSGALQEQQLQRVLEALLEAGDQVCTTPANGRATVDINDDCVRFIAF